MTDSMKANKSNPNKKILRVILAAAALLILCGVFCGTAAADDLTATLSKNSIVEKVTIHDVDRSQGQKYGLNLTASSLLWDKYQLQILEESDLYIKPFELEVTCNRTLLEKVNLTIQFKVNKTKMLEYDALGNYQVRLGHLKEDKKWKLLEVEQVASDDENLHYNVTAQEPTPLFVIVVTKKPVNTPVASNGTATLGEKGKMTIIPSAASIASEVKLEAVSGLNTGDNLSFYNLSGNNPLLIATLENSCPAGYSSQKVISLFALKTTDEDNTGNKVIHMDVTGNESADYKPDNVKVIHFKDGAWEKNYLSSKRSGNTYEVTTDGFSPFAVVYAVPAPTPEPTPQKSSSRDYGASVWLPATAEPTPTPAATEPMETEATQPQPVASPINQPQQQTSSPVPLAGILTGLGAGLAAMALRRR